MTQEKELQSARYGFWGYLVLIVGLAGITAFLLFINQDALLKYGLTYRQIWSVWGGI
jgi:type VI secretion system protein ImpL